MADLDLARRAVACPGWAWRPGMLTTSGLRIVTVLHAPTHGLLYLVARVEAAGGERTDAGLPGRAWWTKEKLEGGPWLPDLDDAATKGAVLGLVRAAWGDPGIGTAQRGDGGWRTTTGAAGPGLLLTTGPTEAAALVAALEAAGRRT